MFLSSSLYQNVQILKAQQKTWPAFLRATGKMPSGKRRIQKTSATLVNFVHIRLFHFPMAMFQLCSSVFIAYIKIQMGSLPNFSPLSFSYLSFLVFLPNLSLTKPQVKYFLLRVLFIAFITLELMRRVSFQKHSHQNEIFTTLRSRIV